MMRLLGQGKYIGMMVDQREWKGLMLSFLGQPAATAHAPALVARRSGVPIFLGRATRLGGAHFELECLVSPASAGWRRHGRVRGRSPVCRRPVPPPACASPSGHHPGHRRHHGPAGHSRCAAGPDQRPRVSRAERAGRPRRRRHGRTGGPPRPGPGRDRAGGYHRRRGHSSRRCSSRAPAAGPRAARQADDAMQVIGTRTEHQRQGRWRPLTARPAPRSARDAGRPCAPLARLGSTQG